MILNSKFNPRRILKLTNTPDYKLLKFSHYRVFEGKNDVLQATRFTFANPPEPTTSLDEFQNSPADCPLPISGPSVVHSANPPEPAMSLDKFLNLPADCPALLGGPSAVHLRETTRDTMPLDKL